MPKIKLTEGWLCRDKDGWVRFYPTPELIGDDWWRTTSRTLWDEDEWAESYDFPLPRERTKMLVDIQL